MRSLSLGRGRFYHGDALEMLASLPANSVDMALLDPPYKITKGGKSRKPDNRARGYRPGGWHSTALALNDGNAGFTHNSLNPSDYMGPIYRVLKPSTHCYVMINTLNLEALLTAARAAGFGLHNVLLWDRVHKITNRWYMKHTELVCFFYKGPARAINKPGSGQIFVSRNRPGRERVHPTQKPIGLLRHYIRNSSRRGDVVLDPFAGSGSTAIAAQKSGRRWITCEIDPVFVDAAIVNIRAQCRSMSRRASRGKRSPT